MRLENYSRRSNLKFFGILEKKNNKRDTNCEELIREVVQKKLGLDPDFTIVRCHRFDHRLATSRKNQDIFSARPMNDKRNPCEGPNIHSRGLFPRG